MGYCLEIQIAQTFKEVLGGETREAPIRSLRTWLLRVVALFDRQIKGVSPELGKHKNASNEKARRLLGWAPGSPKDAVLATARSLFELGLAKAS